MSVFDVFRRIDETNPEALAERLAAAGAGVIRIDCFPAKGLHGRYFVSCSHSGDSLIYEGSTIGVALSRAVEGTERRICVPDGEAES